MYRAETCIRYVYPNPMMPWHKVEEEYYVKRRQHFIIYMFICYKKYMLPYDFILSYL